MKKTLTFIILSQLIAFNAYADLANAPNATLLLGHGAFDNGGSNNLGPAVKQVIDNHWTSGACTSANGFSTCDSLRFGLSIAADDSCEDSYVPLIAPQEDGGLATKNRIQTLHNEAGYTFCDDLYYVPHDSTLELHNDFTFPAGVGASEAVLDQYWERPNLSLMVVGEEARTSGTDDGDRVLNALKNACDNLDGHGGILPSMPTWVMLTRKSNDTAAPYANLLAAAGGTAECCYGAGCSVATDPLDVCAHVRDGRTDAKIRLDLSTKKYNCGAGDGAATTGLLDFGGKKPYGTLPHLRCHLVGENNNDNCSPNGRQATDLLGIFSCVRQVPRNAPEEDTTITWCPSDSDDPDDCEILTEENGGIEWIDPNHTMFLVNKDGDCDITTVDITVCRADEACTVPGQAGRCAAGKTVCTNGVQTCEANYEPMPEICNGLDDDCDGQDDNLSTSWENFTETLPAEHEGLDCGGDDICGCPNGVSDEHAGDDFSAYLNNWSGSCFCGSSLEGGYSEMPVSENSAEQPQAACSAIAPDGSVPVSALFLLLGGCIVGLRRRRA